VFCPHLPPTTYHIPIMPQYSRQLSVILAPLLQVARTEFRFRRLHWARPMTSLQPCQNPPAARSRSWLGRWGFLSHRLRAIHAMPPVGFLEPKREFPPAWIQRCPHRSAGTVQGQQEFLAGEALPLQPSTPSPRRVLPIIQILSGWEARLHPSVQNAPGNRARFDKGLAAPPRSCGRP